MELKMSDYNTLLDTNKKKVRDTGEHEYITYLAMLRAQPA